VAWENDQAEPDKQLQRELIESGVLPNHIAIIMDGNGRWAKARGLPRVAGHRRGADAVRRVVRGAGELGIPVLTLFAFSTENWTRPADEVNDLMGLLRHYLRNELEELHKNGARLRVIGNRDGLAADIVRDIADAEKMTHANGRIDVNICINYGARDEILQATRNLARRVAAGELAAEDIDETRFEQELLTAGVPDPDLLIRTSGEQRISNFLLWQCAYAELVFVDTLWPDFGKDHLEQAIAEFRRRERRYGGVGG
jgi:undecaprenyl diphosphate synthase